MTGWGFLAVAAWGLVAWIVWSGIRAGMKTAPPRPAETGDCGGLACGCPACWVAVIASGLIVGEWLDGD
ncbi:MAG: hypothetical protein F4089_13840 [Gammaproteobacteria bacterium]|nr:hypothetical protein [Gammaproteobacteria bacterium]